jgi:hypothetical protein
MSALDDRPQVLTALMHGYNRISESWAAVLADTDSAPDSPHMRWRDVPNGDPTMALASAAPRWRDRGVGVGVGVGERGAGPSIAALARLLARRAD